jgi:hypothetical protein
LSRPIYSAGWIYERGLNGAGATIVVPENHTYIIKQLTFYSNPLLSPARGFFRDLLTGASLFSCGTQAGTPGWFGFYGALVFAEGSEFRWEVEAELTDGADVYAGGYDLINPPPPA